MAIQSLSYFFAIQKIDISFHFLLRTSNSWDRGALLVYFNTFVKLAGICSASFPSRLKVRNFLPRRIPKNLTTSSRHTLAEWVAVISSLQNNELLTFYYTAVPPRRKTLVMYVRPRWIVKTWLTRIYCKSKKGTKIGAGACIQMKKSILCVNSQLQKQPGGHRVAITPCFVICWGLFLVPRILGG